MKNFSTEHDLKKQRKDEQERFTKFVQELTILSKKYDIAIKSVGGVYFYDHGELQNLVYTNDASSGDLVFEAE